MCPYPDSNVAFTMSGNHYVVPPLPDDCTKALRPKLHNFTRLNIKDKSSEDYYGHLGGVNASHDLTEYYC